MGNKFAFHTIDEHGNLKNKKNRGVTKKPAKLKEYKIDYTMIAKWFGYESNISFGASSAKIRILEGIENVIKYVEMLK